LFDLEPSYSASDEEESGSFYKNSNHRNLLYWEPNTDPRQTPEISFRASEHRSTYQVIVSGITSEGRRIYGTAEFTVD
jgi:hypothetical protein